MSGESGWEIVSCPDCDEQLSEQFDDDFVECLGCGRTISVVLGIPDLRRTDPPYSSREEDLARARAIAEQFDAVDFAGLVRFTYRELHPELGSDEREEYASQRLLRRDINATRWATVQRFMADLGCSPQRARALDVGCGTGGFCVELAQEFGAVIGVDIAMDELVLARKQLDELGITNVALLCAEAETVPVEDGSIQLISATDVVEHLADQRKGLRRMRELLSEDGVLSFNSPNRLDLIYPEPHVGIRWVGLWPRLLQPWIVRRLSGKAYVGKRLLSLRELQGMLSVACPDAAWSVYYWPRWNATGEPRTLLGKIVLSVPVLSRALSRAWAPFVSNHEVMVAPSGTMSGRSRVRPVPLETRA